MSAASFAANQLIGASALQQQQQSVRRPARATVRPVVASAQQPASRPSTSGRLPVVRAAAAPAVLDAPIATSGNRGHYPTAEALATWRDAEAVCFDIDCTVCVNDGLDILADFMGVGQQVANLTNKAMDGDMSLQESLAERLRLINCTPADIEAFLQAYPVESRLTPGAKELVSALQARGTHVYLVSGGFRELNVPVARALGVPLSNLYANRMLWQLPDDAGEPFKLAGFCSREPTGHGHGKPRVIQDLRKEHGYNTVAMVGDGITDLEAVQLPGGADLFVGYGGVVHRPAVAQAADWFVTDFRILA